MNDFATFFAPVFATSVQVFGDNCTINAVVFPCVIHELTLTTEIQAGRAGQSAVAGGSIIMALADWQTSSGKKGSHITVGGEVFRVANRPEVQPTSTTVTIQLGPLT